MASHQPPCPHALAGDSVHARQRWTGTQLECCVRTYNYKVSDYGMTISIFLVSEGKCRVRVVLWKRRYGTGCFFPWIGSQRHANSQTDIGYEDDCCAPANKTHVKYNHVGLLEL